MYPSSSSQDSESLTEWESTGGPRPMFAVSHEKEFHGSESESDFSHLSIVMGKVYMLYPYHCIAGSTPASNIVSQLKLKKIRHLYIGAADTAAGVRAGTEKQNTQHAHSKSTL